MTSDRVTIGATGLCLRGGEGAAPREVPLLSGAVHYFQLPRRHWGACLDAVVELGLPLVESTVPWSIHERPGGHLDLEGKAGSDRWERDLGGFLDACAERRLLVLLRPGPSLSEELTGGGLPERVLRDERCLARGPDGGRVLLPLPPRFTPLPSYASERFLEEAGGWLAAVGAFLAPRCWPAGPVVGVQVEGGGWLRAAAYDQDYHREAIARYRAFLGERHPDGLPEGYRGTPLAELEPPRRFDAEALAALVPHLDWLAFKEDLQLRTLGVLGGVLRAAGVEVPLLHDLAAGLEGGSGIAGAERVVDLAGTTLHAHARSADSLRRSVLRLAGSSRLPYVAELGLGGSPLWLPGGPADELRAPLAALMHGARGWNLHMLVERDRWYGAPIGPTGARRGQRYEALRRLIAAVKDARLPELTREAPLGLLEVPEYARLERCASLLDPLPQAALALVGLGAEELASDERSGLEAPLALEHARLSRLAEEALGSLGLGYCRVQPGALARAAAGGLRLLLAPSFDFMDAELLEELGRFVAGGGRLILAPRRPRLDGAMRPLARELPGHVLASEAELPRVLAAEAAALGLVAVEREPAEVELALLREGGRVAALFLANHGPREVSARVPGLALEGRLFDALDGAPLDLASGVHLAAGQVRLARLALEERARAGEGQAASRSTSAGVAGGGA